MLWSGRAMAQVQIPGGPSGRLTWNQGGVEYVGSYGFRFIRDTRTNTCYIASVKEGAVTAIAEAPTQGCD